MVIIVVYEGIVFMYNPRHVHVVMLFYNVLNRWPAMPATHHRQVSTSHSGVELEWEEAVGMVLK